MLRVIEFKGRTGLLVLAGVGRMGWRAREPMGRQEALLI